VKHRLFTFASALSLLLCVATVALWMSGQCPWVIWTLQSLRLDLTTHVQGVGIDVDTSHQFVRPGWGDLECSVESAAHGPPIKFPSDFFAWPSYSSSPWIAGTVASVFVPYWLLVVAELILPFLWLRRHLAFRRRRDGSRRCGCG
jgi:hypothetical protein